MKPVQVAQPETFLPYMPDVARCELALQEINQMWRLIEASAKMNCPAEARLLLPAMMTTRTGFAHLEQALVANLVQEKVRQVLAEIGTKAQYVIDILVRNLYERTADVGFLATDSDLCRFVAGFEVDDADHALALQRLSEYRAKYTVYDEILLLDTQGRVLAQADPAIPVECSADPLLAETLARNGYVETFRASDLRPGKARALIYSHRMLHPDTGVAIGVLCVCFHFEHEMAAIFEAYRDPGRRANMLLLDAQDRVISSADPFWIPPGAQVPTNCDGPAALLLFSGREYLVSTYASGGYQGYPGPVGWKGQVMIPVDLAFRANGAKALARFEPAMLQGLLSHAHTFSPSLHELMTAVTHSTRTIGGIVWNGKVTATAGDGGSGSGKLNTVLDQITETGARSDALFSRSIQDLYQTVLTSSMRAAEFTSQLLVDMLDRNLYERANDCRWWALTAQLRRGLAQPSDPAQAAAIGSVLAYINGLYTVYSRLFVYDRSGRIVASTGTQDIVGSNVGGETLGRVCALRSVQDHYPEPFAPTPLYDGKPTFIYHAAVRHPEQESQVVGGIGIVFDAQPELLNMLHGGVAARPSVQAYFVTPDGRVLSATDPACPPGSQLDAAAGLLAAASAQDGSLSRIVIHRGQYAIAAATAATGYREFRAGAAGEQDVIGLVLASFGAVRDGVQPAGSAPAVLIEQGSDAGRVYATFYVDRVLMAIPAAHIVESVSFSRVQKTAGGSAARLGMLDMQLSGRQRHSIWVFDLGYLIGGRQSSIGGDSQVILVRHGNDTVGLLVDGLHSVQQFDENEMTSMPPGMGGQALSARLIKANKGSVLIQEICTERLFARLSTPGAA
jgi:chemotaxis signal transduction protein